MDSRFLYAMSGERGGQVYGFRVRFLTLRHVLGLYLIDSPYVLGGEVDDMDVVLAARVLASRDEAAWLKSLGKGGCWERFKSKLAGFYYGKESRREAQRVRLEEWLDREMCTPRVLTGDQKGRRLRCEWLVVLVAKAMRESGVAVETAWWMRFADVAWVKLAWDECDGAEFEILTDELEAELKDLGHTDEDLGI